jgi:hypothetical protein
MISMAEIELRVAHEEWIKAKAAWVKALADVNVAKTEWEAAQAKFYGGNNAMGSAAGCGSCSGCSTGRGCA